MEEEGRREERRGWEGEGWREREGGRNGEGGREERRGWEGEGTKLPQL